MVVNDLFHTDDRIRARALATLADVPEHTRAALAAKLVPFAREAARNVAEGQPPSLPRVPLADPSAALSRIVVALAHLRVESAKSCLLRLAEDKSAGVKRVLTQSLGGLGILEIRGVLIALLSDDDARPAAIEAIRKAPFPEALPALIELAEADDALAREAIPVIAACARAGGAAETNAAADFLVELLEDDGLAVTAAETLLRHGASWTGVAARAKALLRGERRALGHALLAATGEEASFGELFAACAREEVPRVLLHAFDASLLLTAFARARASDDPALRANAEAAWSKLT